MAAPAFVAAGTVVQGTTSVAVPYYAGLAANDIAFIFANDRSNPTLADIAGWTGEPQVAVGGGTANDCRIWWRRLVGSESGNVTVTSTSGAAVNAVMIGVSGAITTGTPYEDYDGTAAGDSTSATSNTITTTGDERLGIRFTATVTVGGAADAPTGWTERVDSVGIAEAISIDTKTIASAGDEAASTRTVATGEWSVLTLAVLPPAVAGQPYAKRMGGVKFVQGFRAAQNSNLWRKAGELLLPPRPSIIRV